MRRPGLRSSKAPGFFERMNFVLSVTSKLTSFLSVVVIRMVRPSIAAMVPMNL